MIDHIEPFHRTSTQTGEGEGRPWLVAVMRFHFLLVGVVLFIGAVGLAGYVFSLQLSRTEWDLASLRIERTGKVYDVTTQQQLMLAVILGLASLLYFRAVRQIGTGSGGLWRARLAGILLLAGFPGSWFVWQIELESVPVPSALWGALAGLLLAQSLLALLYTLALWRNAAVRRVFARDRDLRPTGIHRVRRVGGGLWVLLVLGTGVALGVMTDWVYELPVERPQPGELLYATSFDTSIAAEYDTDAFEWDTYEGRDSAQIVALRGRTKLVKRKLGAGASSPAALPYGEKTLVISHGAPISNETVWSALDRKFSDFDLRTRVRPVSGPMDNQFGVIFRYRDSENFYIFNVSSDGYYSLTKVKDGVRETVSTWVQSPVVIQNEPDRNGLIARSNIVTEIRVVARGDQYRFFLNGEPVPLCLRGTNEFSMWADMAHCVEGGELTYIYEDSAFGQGRIALAAGSSADLSDAVVVAFHDVVIVGPDSDVMIVELAEE